LLSNIFYICVTIFKNVSHLFIHHSRMIRKFFSPVIILFLCIFCQAAPIGDSPLIVDTDCALDDMRAIGMLLSYPGIKIQGIIVTEGTLLPEEGAKKVRSLLHVFALDTVPVYCGRRTNKPGPPWREFNRSVAWGSFQHESKSFSEAVPWLQTTLETSPDRIIYLCLGPLSTLAAVLESHTDLGAKINRIIWYNESVKTAAGFNYSFDKAAADSILQMKIRIDILSAMEKEDAFIDASVYEFSKNFSTGLSRLLSTAGDQTALLEKQHEHHLRIADELVAAYYTNAELFDMTTMHPQVHIRYNKEYDLQSVKEVFTDMIRGIYKKSNTIVFSAFPDQSEMFTYDVRKILDSAIARYGTEEWKACVMTDEFHGHLGVFSIVGAKMGIKARDLFDVGPDKLRVTTYAGTKPPYSCLNDGIQVSTGATVGQGLITIAGVENTKPEAIFTYKGKSYRLTLKDEYLAIVNHDIEEGILKFGLLDDGYWKLVRRSALKYWLEWDRDVIFEVEEININN
jgi:pyrimidine-specific ribonucleoside hydrolase